MSVGIGYRERTEVVEMAGKTVAEAREKYQSLFGIPARARAILNGRVVGREDSVKLHDCDELAFAMRSRSKMPLLVGALLLAMALTGGMFAYTYVTATNTLGVTSGGADFAAVSDNTSVPLSWTVIGNFKGNTGGGLIFDVNTLDCGYTGDLTVTVSLVNLSQLVLVYRDLSLKIEVYDATNNKVDINADNVADNRDFAMLNLSNGVVNLFITQSTPSIYTVKVVSGSYFSNPYGGGWPAGYEDPVLYAEASQR